MVSRPARHRYCRCGTHLAVDNPGRQCARCQRVSRDRLIAPPHVPPEFWQTKQFRDAFAAQHIGRLARAYRTHPYHHTVYGPEGISQALLGQWLGLRQPQISRIEGGAPIRNLDTLAYWARVLRIPAELLWFKLPDERHQLVTTEPQSPVVPPASDTSDEHVDDPERDPVLITPWNHRGTVEVAVVLSGGDGRVKRRVFLSLTGPALTAPAHQWLVHEPEPLVSGLSGRRVSGELVARLGAMVAELRRMDDVAGGGSVLAMAQQAFDWVARLLDRASYSERTGRALHVVLAELGQLCGWSAYDGGDFGLAQRYNIVGLRAAHSAADRPLGAHILATMANQAARQGTTRGSRDTHRDCTVRYARTGNTSPARRTALPAGMKPLQPAATPGVHRPLSPRPAPRSSSSNARRRPTVAVLDGPRGDHCRCRRVSSATRAA